MRAISASISDWFEIEIDYLPACRLSSTSNLRLVLIFLPYNWPASCRQHWIVPDDCVSARLVDVLVFLEKQSSEIVSWNMLHVCEHWNTIYVIVYRVEFGFSGIKQYILLQLLSEYSLKFVFLSNKIVHWMLSNSRVISKWNSKSELVSHKYTNLCGTEFVWVGHFIIRISQHSNWTLNCNLNSTLDVCMCAFRFSTRSSPKCCLFYKYTECAVVYILVVILAHETFMRRWITI